MVSKKLRDTIKLSERQAYRIAQEAGLHPSTLSRLLNGIEKAQPGDERVLRVGQVMGVPENECFEESIKKQAQDEDAAPWRGVRP